MKKDLIPQDYSMRTAWVRNCLFVLFDAAAVMVPGIIITLLFKHIAGSLLYSYFSLAVFTVGFVIIGEKVQLYNGRFFSPGFPLAPQEELRRIFYVILGLMTVRLFYFPEFPEIVQVQTPLAGRDYLLKMLLSYLPLPFVFFSLVWMRWLARTLMLRLRIGQTPVAVWGAGRSGSLLIDILHKSRYHGLRPVIVLDDDPEKSGSTLHGVPVRQFHEVEAQLKNSNVRHVIVCLPFAFVIEKLNICSAIFREISILGAVHDFPNIGSYLHDLYGLTIVEYRSGLRSPVNVFMRYCLNTVTSFCVIILLSPLMLIIAGLVKITSAGPVLYRAERLGRNGRPIWIYKFRTMYHNASGELEKLLEENPAMKDEWQKTFKLKNDPRVTPVGTFLRKSSLDELPQIFSVLKGDLNLVGPRPIVKDELQYYGHDYNLISSVAPGLTGMWQVSGRNNTSYAERVLLEKYYVLNWSPWLDIYIIIKTVLEVILCRGAY